MIARNALRILAVSAVLVGLGAVAADACSVCYGDPESPQVKAMKMGILLLLGVVGTVLAGFGGLFLYWVSRHRRLSLMEKGATH
jgi:hypothetical protein